MYFILKQAAYDHGVFWIGTDIEEGKKKAKEFAEASLDDYHEYSLFEYNEISPDDYSKFNSDEECEYWMKFELCHKLIASFRKGDL